MSLITKHAKRTKRRTLRVRNAVKHYDGLPRVSVFRSLKQIYAQIIDDTAQKTLVSCSSLEFKAKKKEVGDKKAIAKSVGIELAKRAKDKGISNVCFDRGPFLYHGRVKELVEGLREGGLQV